MAVGSARPLYAFVETLTVSWVPIDGLDQSSVHHHTQSLDKAGELQKALPKGPKTVPAREQPLIILRRGISGHGTQSVEALCY